VPKKKAFPKYDSNIQLSKVTGFMEEDMPDDEDDEDEEALDDEEQQ